MARVENIPTSIAPSKPNFCPIISKRRSGNWITGNVILGREMAPEEAEFLTQPGSSF